MLHLFRDGASLLANFFGVGFVDHRRSDKIKISADLAAFFSVSFHSHAEVRNFSRRLLLNRSFLDLAGARIQRSFQVPNLFQEFQLFRNNVCTVQDGIAHS